MVQQWPLPASTKCFIAVMWSSALSKKRPLGENGHFLNLDSEMSHSLLQTVLDLLSEVRNNERAAVERQREKTRVKKEALLKKGLYSATRDYVEKLHYREVCDSTVCWKTCRKVDNELKLLGSMSTRCDALKDQIKMRVLRLSWEDCHHPWSKGGELFSPNALATHLKDGISKKHRKREIPPKPLVDLPTRKSLPILGSLSPDIVRHDAAKAKEEIKLMEAAEKRMKKLEEKGYGDRFAYIQQRLAPKVDN